MRKTKLEKVHAKDLKEDDVVNISSYVNYLPDPTWRRICSIEWFGVGRTFLVIKAKDYEWDLFVSGKALFERKSVDAS